jgi:hypothetical protein
MYGRHNIGYICDEWECFSCCITHNNIPVVLLAFGVSWQSVQVQDTNAKDRRNTIQIRVQRPNYFSPNYTIAIASLIGQLHFLLLEMQYK